MLLHTVIFFGQILVEVFVKNRVLKYFVVVPLIVATLLPCFPWTSVSAQTQDTVADFGVSDPDRNTTLSGSELLELLLGIDIGDAEAAYIDQSGLYKFTYSAAIPASTISAELKNRNSVDGLLVTVSDWTYTAQNGETVSWKPFLVTVNGEKKNVDGAGEYFFEGEWTDDEEFKISAQYEAVFPIDCGLYNSLANFAYTGAKEKDGELLEYDAKRKEYELSWTVYNEYQKNLNDYSLALSRYNLYLAALEEYKEKQKTYEYYLLRLEQYTKAKEAYDVYLVDLESYNAAKELYDEYCVALDNYNAQSNKYKDYINRTEVRMQKLSVMESIYAKNSIGQNLYATILGDTVDTVVKNKSEIVGATKTPAEAVDLAGECTENLRRMLKEYRELKTDREKYLYYEENYTALCTNFKDLYISLRSFYDNTTVRMILTSNGKMERYRQFLAQLYVITTSMDDGYLRDENWNLYLDTGDYVTVSDLLEPVHIIHDLGTAGPQTSPGWPDEVAEPTAPAEVAKPTKPTEVAPPGRKPTEIAEPKAPAEVAEPTEPTEVEMPGDAPMPPELTAAERGIVEALRGGRLKARDEVSGNVIIRRTATASKTVSDLEKYHVRFLNGSTVVLEYDVNPGAELRLPTETPVKADTDEFSYSFGEWRDEDGRVAVVTEVNSDLEFYASFTSKTKSYPITWDVNGVIYTENVEYGTVPTFGGDTQRPMDERKIYTFIGWDNKPMRVTGAATYVAQYAESDRLYDVSWNIGGTTVTEQYKYADTPSYKGLVDKAADGTYVYTFEGWSPSVEPVSGNASYTAIYSQQSLVLDSAGGALPVRTENASYVVEASGSNVDITVLYEQALKKEYGIVIEFADCTLTLGSRIIESLSGRRITKVAASADGNEARLMICDESGAVIVGGESAVLEYDNLDDTGAELFGRVDSQEEPMFVEDGKVVLNIASGQTVQIVKKYTVSLISSEEGSYSVSAQRAEAGETIQLNQKMIRQGYVVKEITVTSILTGEAVDFDEESMTFLMPVGGATVEILHERQTFKVTFVVDGAVISEKLYYLGDTVELPETPAKPSEGNYTYTFSGWSPEVVTVEGDAEYTAIFTETKLADQSEMSNPDFKSREYEWLILFGVIGVIVAGACVTVKCVKRSKRKKKDK